jgi:hypothetical protein
MGIWYDQHLKSDVGMEELASMHVRELDCKILHCGDVAGAISPKGNT